MSKFSEIRRPVTPERRERIDRIKETMMASAHVVDLDENPSTGYFWEIVNIPSRLTVTSTFTQSVSEAGGESGTRRFVFEGPPGAYAVKLAHRRPWEITTPLEVKTIEFTLDDTPVQAPGAIGAEMIKEDT